MTTEDKPHVVFRAANPVEARVYENFGLAHEWWLVSHHHSDPYLIATLGRVIDPSEPIIDVNE